MYDEAVPVVADVAFPSQPLDIIVINLSIENGPALSHKVVVRQVCYKVFVD